MRSGAPMPERIVSLVPSLTELLFHLGVEDRVAGITKFCTRPANWAQGKLKIGGTKTVDIEKVKALNPDLVIANKEENTKEQVEALAEICPVYLSDINTLDTALEMIDQVGQLVFAPQQAAIIIKKIREGFDNLRRPFTTIKTAYLIWRNPYMTVGGDTFISNMLQQCGFENVFENEIRYPEITIGFLQLQHCELLILSSEPYPFSQKHITELQGHLPDCKIILADGEMFSWYGSRLLEAPAYIQNLRKTAAW